MSISRIIKNRRLELGLTLKDVADSLGVAESTVSRYESSDIQNMGIDKIEALAKVLDCSPGYLMGWEESLYDSYDPQLNIIIEGYKTMSPAYRKQLQEYAKTLMNLQSLEKNTPKRYGGVSRKFPRKHINAYALKPANDRSTRQVKFVPINLEDVTSLGSFTPSKKRRTRKQGSDTN